MRVYLKLLFHTIAHSNFSEHAYSYLLTVPRLFFKQNLVTKPFPNCFVNTTAGHVLHHFLNGKKDPETTYFNYVHMVCPKVDVANFCNIPAWEISGIENEGEVKHMHFSVLNLSENPKAIVRDMR